MQHRDTVLFGVRTYLGVQVATISLGLVEPTLVNRSFTCFGMMANYYGPAVSFPTCPIFADFPDLDEAGFVTTINSLVASSTVAST